MDVSTLGSASVVLMETGGSFGPFCAHPQCSLLGKHKCPPRPFSRRKKKKKKIWILCSYSGGCACDYRPHLLREGERKGFGGPGVRAVSLVYFEGLSLPRSKWNKARRARVPCTVKEPRPGPGAEQGIPRRGDEQLAPPVKGLVLWRCVPGRWILEAFQKSRAARGAHLSAQNPHFPQGDSG